MAAATHVCAVCSDNFIVNSKSLKCDYCEELFHIGCVRIKDQFVKFKQENHNIKWYCNDCVKQVEKKLNKRGEDVSVKTQEVLDKTDKLLNILENHYKPKYSDILKNSTNIEPLIIKPKKPNQNSSQTKSVLEQKICPENIAVSKVKHGSHGCVVVHCDDKKSLENLKTKTQKELGEEYEITIGKTINPKIKIINIKKEHLLNEDDFLTKLKHQNLPEDLKKSFKMIRKYTSAKSKKDTYNVILEINPEIYNYITKKDKLYVDWDSYKYFEFVSVLRCFHCWKYGHYAEKCTEKQVCPKCNLNHKMEECTSNKSECTNCKYANDVLKIPGIKYDHHVFDSKCPCYQRQIKTIRNRINYTI